MENYRLGLDIGTNSIGWCVLALDANGNPDKIKDAGVRVFNDGRDVKSKATLKATRRENRSARRRRDRFKQRQVFLLDEMTKAGLLPAEEEKRKKIQKLNPLELRALALKEKLHPYHVGRALFHLNQRRGFKSNRKDRSKENLSGKISNSVKALLEQMQLIERSIDPDEYSKLSKEEKKLCVNMKLLSGRKPSIGSLPTKR